MNRLTLPANSDRIGYLPVVGEELVALADLVAVPCHVTSAGPHRAGGLDATYAAARMMSVPTPGATIWIVVGERSFRSGPVLHNVTTADDVAVQLVVRTLKDRLVLDFSRAAIFSRVDETRHPLELAN